MSKKSSSLRQVAVWTALYYLRFWARIALQIGRPTTVGIAGSVGKTSTKLTLYAMLQETHRVKYTEGNSETGVPLGILGLSKDLHSSGDWLLAMLKAPLSVFNLLKCQILIVEMATDDPYPPKNMDYLLTIVKPDIAIFLNTFPIHTEQFSKLLDELDQHRLSTWTEEQKIDFVTQSLANEDAKIITQNPNAVAIYNTDNYRVVEQLVEHLSHEPLRQTYRFGSQDDVDIRYGAYQVSPQGTSFELIIKDEVQKIDIKTYLLPEVYREVIAASLLVGLHLGLERSQLVDSLQKNFHLPPGRSAVFSGVNQNIIIDSTYNSATASVDPLLKMVADLKNQVSMPVIAILGDMREMGPAAPSEHIQLAQSAVNTADEIILVGPLTKEYCLPLIQQTNTPVRWFPTAHQLISEFNQSPPSSSLLLFKGSQSTIYLEEAIKPLLTDPNDHQKLCRQQPYWLKVKAEFFQSQ